MGGPALAAELYLLAVDRGSGDRRRNDGQLVSLAGMCIATIGFLTAPKARSGRCDDDPDRVRGGRRHRLHQRIRQYRWRAWAAIVGWLKDTTGSYAGGL